jgi:diacylglycerol O-acyltransferase
MATAKQASEVALRWGATREMNALEALMWRAEVDPRLRSPIVGVELLDCAPDWDRFVQAHEWATRMVPRFRQRVVEAPLGIGTPSWVVDERFDLHYHLRRTRLPEDGGWPDLLAVAEQAGMTPFDRTRSPWEATLVEGLPDGKAGYVLKMHHSSMDGIGGMQLLTQLHSRRRDPDPGKAQPPPPEPEATTPVGTLARSLVRDAGSVPHTLRRAGGLLMRLGRPDHAVRDAARYSGSLRRMLARPDATGSPLLRERSLSWRFAAMDVDFADFRAATKAGHGSLNDGFIAALLGAYRHYHEQMGCPVETIPMGIPISVRRSEDEEGGNRIAAARLVGPVGIVDPVQRMAAIRRQIRTARDEPALDAMAMVAPALARLPGTVISHVAGPVTMGNDLQASNVPGIRDEDVFLAGAQIERFYPYAPLPGCAAMITMLTHGDTCCIGANLDAAAFTDLERFGQCLELGFQELLDLHPGSAAPVRRI